ncbi:helix-turn-helix domain-containing protein [Sphingobacterium paludis]|uniref:Helix-turn-helix protein n=1 Tax=Sphingobacterium paludis TaxID=1476465 RepID=A0A4R7D198_9SPHI|nr:helix-turn-helix domain-containing protein [Sphingobacterium paludis]TDS13821.1 helix-turn-helix protein [Sphingobacterium paludis]
MVLFISPSKAQLQIAEQIRAKRLAMNLTQEGLADRSGVALPTLRKFEQKGSISLASFVKLLMVVGGAEEVIEALRPPKAAFASIDDVLKEDDNIYNTRKRGRKR